jgi:hypothetical protein
MSRSKDPLALSPHWHVDYRLESELPEDAVVGKRFLTNVAFAVPALVALVFCIIYHVELYVLEGDIKESEQYINKNKEAVRKIDEMQFKYDNEAAMIDQAHAWVQPQFFVSGFVAGLGRTRREQIAIDLIEWNDAGILLRGSLRGRPDQATGILRDYLAVLNKDEKIKSHFETIKVTDVGRGAGGDSLRFEIKFSLKDRK